MSEIRVHHGHQLPDGLPSPDVYLTLGTDGLRQLRMAAGLASIVPWSVDDLDAEGRDGSGRKPEIPWAGVYSASRSPSATATVTATATATATEGWYLASMGPGGGSWKPPSVVARETERNVGIDRQSPRGA
jgi:hypothetical protein